MKRQEETVEVVDDIEKQSARRERLIARFEQRKVKLGFMGPFEKKIELFGLCVAPEDASIVRLPWHDKL